MTVVCISRDVGAEGETVGRLVAERLGLRYLDEEVITRAAERGGVDEAQLADVEQRKRGIMRILEFLGDAGALTGVQSPEPPSLRTAREESHRAMIRGVVEEIADEGNAVICAHAASMAVAGRDGMLRVLVTASPEVRLDRLTESEGSREKAAKVIKDGEAGRAAYFKRFYSVDQELPTHYDLVVNTDLLRPEQAAEIIVHAAGVVDAASAK